MQRIRKSAISRAEKQAIYNRLLDYRKRNGLGCLDELTSKTLTANEIRAIMAGDVYPQAKWKELAAALDSCERGARK